jgi:hypothetical protein
MRRGHARFSVDYLYSLYDALVSINVPSDKARAVVDAMERDMGTTLATKQDLEFLRRDIENRFTLVDQKFEGLRSHSDQRFETLRADISREFVAFELRMTVKFGSMLMVGFGLTIAALRLWS